MAGRKEKNGRRFSARRISLFEIHDDFVDGEALACLDGDGLDDGALFGAQRVFHLHGFDGGKGLAGLDLIADIDQALAKAKR